MASGFLEFETAVMICSVYRPEKLVHAVQSVPPQYRVLVMCWSKKDVTHNLGGRARIIDEDSRTFFQRKKEGRLWGITEGSAICKS